MTSAGSRGREAVFERLAVTEQPIADYGLPTAPSNATEHVVCGRIDLALAAGRMQGPDAVVTRRRLHSSGRM
ncbi:hypothetical protein OG883_38900 [Streptomyces sp. NBC_01142]|uniref:hypothetical protein n=1 Tax=Streptomyces sp. NBC_01142 TaxID=2975865 RepID=UPI0022553C31|nr:hypothetical protein [Streptomyces sp. NBC_01142]MCX4825711.1 hypothetical protein [Streptomyces sp. NBC_01142]